MRRKWIGILTVVGCAAAVAAVALYINAWLRELNGRQMYLQRLQTQVAQLDGKQMELHRNLARWYNHTLEHGAEDPEAYPSILSFGGDMGWLILPGEQVLPIHHGGRASPCGAVHDPSSPLPLDSAGMPTVLHLTAPPEEALARGDKVEVFCLDQKTVYHIEKTFDDGDENHIWQEGKGLILLVPGEMGQTALLCLPGAEPPSADTIADRDISPAAPAMAAAGSALLPAAVWVLRESIRKLRKTSKKADKTDEKPEKSGKYINKHRVSRK